jgi:hypothetical protein
VHPEPNTSTPDGLNLDQVLLNVPADENIWIKAEVSSGKGDLQYARIPAGSTEVIQLDLRNGTLQADFPGSSPDGTELAFTLLTSDNPDYFSIAEDYSCDVFIMPASGGSPTQMTHDGNSKDPSWGIVSE